jgi:hypothetical protein
MIVLSAIYHLSTVQWTPTMHLSHLLLVQWILYTVHMAPVHMAPVHMAPTHGTYTWHLHMAPNTHGTYTHGTCQPAMWEGSRNFPIPPKNSYVPMINGSN